MRDCLVLINNDGTVETDCAQQYIGEHTATRLVITLNDELTADGISYHMLCFNTGADNANPFKIKFCSDIITESSANGYIQDGIIYFPMPKALTQCRNLTVQVEAHTADEEQTVTKIVKSPAFTIPFAHSVDGEEDIIPEKSFELIEELRKALTQMNASVEEIELNTYARHTHSNKATLDVLNCNVLENGGIYSGDSDFDLTFSGKSIRLKADGSVISTVTGIERNGATYLRLGLSGEKNALDSSFPTYIDIPVSSVTATAETDENGVVVNGSELDLGINEIKDEVSAHIPTKTSELENDSGFVTSTNAKSGSFIHVSFDDVTLCIQNLINNTYSSVFDEPLFAWLKSLNEQYGARFSLYIMDISNLANVPDTYKSEFLAAKDWLKFGLHSNTASSTYAEATYETGAADWNYFVTQIIRITGTFETIDRVPRLHYFHGSKEALQGMRDCECGALGFLAADDSRPSYYLDSSQNAFLKTHDSIIDFENGLIFYNTDFRGDWFKEGFTSENTYNAPTKTNAYDELLYRFTLAKYADTFKSYTYFCHEWQFYDGTTLNDYKAWTEDVCRFGSEYNIPFDYPQNRLTVNPTSFKFLSANSDSSEEDVSGEYLLSEYVDFARQSEFAYNSGDELFTNRVRAYDMSNNFTFKVGDTITIGDYSVYDYAIGDTAGTTAADNWFNGGYLGADYTLSETEASTIERMIIKRLDEADITEEDLSYIKANTKVIRG